jgi:hypothetical protein
VLTDRPRERLSKRMRLTEKRMLGGLAFLANGNISGAA